MIVLLFDIRIITFLTAKSSAINMAVVPCSNRLATFKARFEVEWNLHLFLTLFARCVINLLLVITVISHYFLLVRNLTRSTV